MSIRIDKAKLVPISGATKFWIIDPCYTNIDIEELLYQLAMQGERPLQPIEVDGIQMMIINTTFPEGTFKLSEHGKTTDLHVDSGYIAIIECTPELKAKIPNPETFTIGFYEHIDFETRSMENTAYNIMQLVIISYRDEDGELQAKTIIC